MTAAAKKSRRETHPIGSRYGWKDAVLEHRLGPLVPLSDDTLDAARAYLARAGADDLAEALGLS